MNEQQASLWAAVFVVIIIAGTFLGPYYVLGPPPSIPPADFLAWINSNWRVDVWLFGFPLIVCSLFLGVKYLTQGCKEDE